MMRSLLAGVALAMWAGSAAAGSITLFSEADFRGERTTLRYAIGNLAEYPPWNDRARSLVVSSGTWEVCRHKNFKDCTVLRAGSRVGDLGQIGMFRQISSLRELDAYGRRDDRWDDRWNDRPRYGWNDPSPPPPPWGWGPPRHDDGIHWDDDRSGGLSRCQAKVYEGFVDRFGYRARASFSGRPDDGTIWWNREAWRFRCSNGRVHIWQ
ncbi:conserved hypothetical protein [Rhodospirillum centenum SW]|uniref:Beta/gamma crystallin 'Greek key' domain-containing protein n=3 Tax=Rhodospirillum centenum TaxID=34018 RepID=B6IP19_RHOCS|nr:unknown [Rhodospirillum centenum]ACI99439.1 conserved hypothetical protein [Rhodospirillum centenum SW]